jgi:hypothetical protein
VTKEIEMHGLVNRAIQCFLRDTYGAETWSQIARRAELGFDNFESMLHYDDAVTDTVIAAASQVLSKPRDSLAEDLGTYLVSHPNTEALRRLLRFSGTSYFDFLQSLDDLPDRVRLAVSDLTIPPLELVELGEGAFRLTAAHGPDGIGHVLVGVLRALADDYGALVLMEHEGRVGDVETVAIMVHDADFAEGRSFHLGGVAP